MTNRLRLILLDLVRRSSVVDITRSFVIETSRLGNPEVVPTPPVAGSQLIPVYNLDLLT